MKRLLALAALATIALWACSTSAQPAQVATASPLRSDGSPLPSGGISRDRAIELAQASVSGMSFQDATVGPSRNFAQHGDGTASSVKPDQLVWAVRFTGDITICTPVGTCWSPRPATSTVVLDFQTGEFLNSWTVSLNNR